MPLLGNLFCGMALSKSGSNRSIRFTAMAVWHFSESRGSHLLLGPKTVNCANTVEPFSGREYMCAPPAGRAIGYNHGCIQAADQTTSKSGQSYARVCLAVHHDRMQGAILPLVSLVSPIYPLLFPFNRCFRYSLQTSLIQPTSHQFFLIFNTSSDTE